MKRLWWLISELHYMSSLTLHELFATLTRNETPLLADVSLPLHEILYTTWVFQPSVGKGICWMIYSLHYMSFFTLHGFFERIYRNETPLLAYLWLPLHEFLYTTWTFACVYWNETPVMVKSICWLVYSLHYMSFLYTTWVFRMYIPESNDLLAYLWLTLHEIHYTTWTFCTCILEWNASDGLLDGL